MANIAARRGSLSFIIKSLTPVRLTYVVSSRLYSQFPTNYVKPVFNKEKQSSIDGGDEAEMLAHLPILPAYTSETSSEFHDQEIEKFINFIMREGKKNVARDMLHKAFENIKRIQLERYYSTNLENREDVELDPRKIFHMAISNATPVMDLLKMKRGGITYQVPVPILEGKQRFLSMNWIIKAAKDKQRRVNFPVSLAKELVDAAYNQGRVVKRKQDLHKLCDANRAYAHFRWT